MFSSINASYPNLNSNDFLKLTFFFFWIRIDSSVVKSSWCAYIGSWLSSQHTHTGQLTTVFFSSQENQSSLNSMSTCIHIPAYRYIHVHIIKNKKWILKNWFMPKIKYFIYIYFVLCIVIYSKVISVFFL